MSHTTVVHKYTLNPTPGRPQQLELPKEAKILHIADQYGYIRLWALVDPVASNETRTFQVFGTGQPVYPAADYIGTLQMEPFVWHIFELNS